MGVVKVVREFGGIRVDTRDWPMIVLEYPEAFADTDAEASLVFIAQVMTEGLSAGERCAQITDLTRIQGMPPASQRKIAGEWVRRNAGLIQSASVGGAAVSRSAILRGVVTAVHWFHRPPTPTEFFATRPEAVRFVIGLLEKGGIHAGPRLRELAEMGDDGAGVPSPKRH